jgi:hypothetical protein
MNNVIVHSLLAKPEEYSRDVEPKLVVSMLSWTRFIEADVQKPVSATELTVTTGFVK